MNQTIKTREVMPIIMIIYQKHNQPTNQDKSGNINHNDPILIN